MERVRRWFMLITPFIALLVCYSTIGFGQAVGASGVSCQLGAPDGARRYRPGAWSIVEFRAVNRTDTASEVQAVLRFVDDPTILFSRHATVLPHSVLRSTCPVLVPSSIPPRRRHIDFLTEQVLPPKEVKPGKIVAPQELMLQSQPMLLDMEDTTVGMVADLLQYLPSVFEHSMHTSTFPSRVEPDEAIYNMVLAAKRSRKLSRRVSSFDPKDLPSDPACLDMLDLMVLSSDRIALDPAGLALLRDWVLRGGHLWITLEDVEPETVSALLGDTFTCSVIDRVELNTVAIRNLVNTSMSEEIPSFELEEPVEMVRVLAEDVTVTHTIDDWPAAFWQPFGDGRVYFTTLGPHAWMRPTTRQDPPPLNREYDTPFVPRDSLADLANDSLNCGKPPQLETETLKPYLSLQIGYRILNRGVVFSALTVFCLLLVCVGWRLYHVGRAERLLWVAPLLAVAFAAVFLGCGAVSKRSVPPTAATIARVICEPGVSVGHSYGLVALYNQDANSDRLAAERGGIFYPDMTAMSGRKRRLTWTDEGAWYWEDLELPAGVRTAPFESLLSLNAAMRCQASFGPHGLEGEVGPLPFGNPQDALIAVPHRNVLAASIDADGSIHARPDDVLAAGEFLTESLVSEEQVRRKSIYVELLQRKVELDAHSRPVLYAWTEPYDMGFVFPQEKRPTSTLLSIPVRLLNTPPGTVVRVPSPFVPYRVVTGPDGATPLAYTNLTHQWIECKIAATQWLRFQMPATVLPLELHNAAFTLSMQAPSRTVEIVTQGVGQEEVVLRLKHPMGTYHCELDRPAALQLDAKGGLLLALRVGEDESAKPSGQMSQAEWLVEEIQMEVTGAVRGE